MQPVTRQLLFLPPLCQSLSCIFTAHGCHPTVTGRNNYSNHALAATVHTLQGWLGGWLLPQEKSYFALKLPHGWWMFGLDLALTHDIDMCQLRSVVLERCCCALFPLTQFLLNITPTFIAAAAWTVMLET